MGLEYLLINKGYKEGNNCYYLIRDNNTFYFNLDDNGFYTNVTLECGSHGSAEIEIFEKANLSALEELEKNNYSIDLFEQ